jgi:hypothetical protein
MGRFLTSATILLFLIVPFICHSTDSFDDMPPGLKEAWTHGTHVKQYYTDRKTGEVTVFSRPVRYGVTPEKKKKIISELPPSFGNSPKYIKKSGTRSQCKSGYSKRPTFELPPEAFGDNCGSSLSKKIAAKKRILNSHYKVEKLTNKEFKKRRKKELEEAKPDHKLTWYELMKRKNKKEERLNKIKASVEAEEKRKARIAKQKLRKVKPVRTSYSSYPNQAPFKRNSKFKGSSTAKVKKGKGKSRSGKAKGKVFGFAKKGSSKQGVSRRPSGNFSSSQSPSSTRMIYYSPNKGSSYEWGRNSKQIKR